MEWTLWAISLWFFGYCTDKLIRVIDESTSRIVIAINSRKN